MDCSLPGSMEFSRQEYWSGLSFPSPGHLLDPGIESVSPVLAGGFTVGISCKTRRLPGLSPTGPPSCGHSTPRMFPMLPHVYSPHHLQCKARRDGPEETASWHKAGPCFSPQGEPDIFTWARGQKGQRSLVVREQGSIYSLSFPVLYSSVYSCHFYLISSASVRSIPFLSVIVPIFS